MTKWIYSFNEVEAAEKQTGSWDGVRSLLGGKGANLSDMTRIDLPVPPGFVVSTEACNAYSAAGQSFPEGMWDEEVAALKVVEEQTGKKFGDPDNPLLVSCRSGAKFSMPGMMDTVSMANSWDSNSALGKAVTAYRFSSTGLQGDLWVERI